VTYTRRFFGDNWLEGILMAITLGIGWLIWFAVVAPKGQTPAKRILNVYIHDRKTGRVASAGQVWLREIGGKYAIPFLLGLVGMAITGTESGYVVLVSLYSLVAAIWVFFDQEHRALWDIVAGTIVRHHRQGFEMSPRTTPGVDMERRLQELDALRGRGILTQDEYEQKRRDVIANF
jgi:uncharacterized RDD family membrane protein YckC